MLDFSHWARHQRIPPKTSACPPLAAIGAVPEYSKNRVVLATTTPPPVNTAAQRTAQSERSGARPRALKHLVLLLLHTTHHHALLSALSSITPTPTPTLSVLYPLIGFLVSAPAALHPAQSPRLGPRPNGYGQTAYSTTRRAASLTRLLAAIRAFRRRTLAVRLHIGLPIPNWEDWGFRDLRLDSLPRWHSRPTEFEATDRVLQLSD